jgi:hypothetical protein
MHVVKVQSWLNGELSTFEEMANGFDDAMEKVGRHHEHHRFHSQGHTIKVYNDGGELVHSQNGTPADTNTYA